MSDCVICGAPATEMRTAECGHKLPVCGDEHCHELVLTVDCDECDRYGREEEA